jgi:hypothetical protein
VTVENEVEESIGSISRCDRWSTTGPAWWLAFGVERKEIEKWLLASASSRGKKEPEESKWSRESRTTSKERPLKKNDDVFDWLGESSWWGFDVAEDIGDMHRLTLDLSLQDLEIHCGENSWFEVEMNKESVWDMMSGSATRYGNPNVCNPIVEKFGKNKVKSYNMWCVRMCGTAHLAGWTVNIGHGSVERLWTTVKAAEPATATRAHLRMFKLTFHDWMLSSGNFTSVESQLSLLTGLNSLFAAKLMGPGIQIG